MVRISSAARPTVDERFLASGWSSRSLRYSVGISPETRERRNTSPSEEVQLGGLRSAKARGMLEDGVQDVSRVRHPRGRAPRGSRGSPRTAHGRLAARWCSSFEARDTRVVRSLRSPTRCLPRTRLSLLSSSDLTEELTCQLRQFANAGADGKLGRPTGQPSLPFENTVHLALARPVGAELGTNGCATIEIDAFAIMELDNDAF